MQSISGLPMSESNNDIKWHLDGIRFIVFCNKEIDFPKKELSKKITNRNNVISMTPSSENNSVEKQYIEIVPLDESATKQFHLTYIENRNIFDFQLMFNDENKNFTLKEINEELDSFYSNLQVVFEYFKDSVIRIGKVIELSIPTKNDSEACNFIRNNFKILKDFDHDLNEINLKLNKSYKYNDVLINRVIRVASGQKISLDIESKNTKADIVNSVLLNIDVNTDASRKEILDLESFCLSLRTALSSRSMNGGAYNE